VAPNNSHAMMDAPSSHHHHHPNPKYHPKQHHFHDQECEEELEEPLLAQEEELKSPRTPRDHPCSCFREGCKSSSSTTTTTTNHPPLPRRSPSCADTPPHTLPRKRLPSLQSFLEDMGLEKYVQLFIDADVTMEDLLSIDDTHLEELGLPVGAKVRIKQGLEPYLTSSPLKPRSSSRRRSNISTSDGLCGCRNGDGSGLCCCGVGNPRNHNHHVVLIPSSSSSSSSSPNNHTPMDVAWRPQDYCTLSFLSCCCCNPICGSIALVHSYLVDERYARGDVIGAHQASRQAKCCAGIACLVGLTTVITTLSLFAMWFSYNVLWSSH